MTKVAKYQMNQREKMPEGIEVRYHDDGTVDEIIVRDSNGVCLLHMEQMCDSRFWIGLHGYGDQSYPVHIDIYTNGTMVKGDVPEESHYQQIFARVRL